MHIGSAGGLIVASLLRKGGIFQEAWCGFFHLESQTLGLSHEQTENCHDSHVLLVGSQQF